MSPAFSYFSKNMAIRNLKITCVACVMLPLNGVAIKHRAIFLREQHAHGIDRQYGL